MSSLPPVVSPPFLPRGSCFILLLAGVAPGVAGLLPKAPPAEPPAIETPAKPLSGDATRKLLEQLESIEASLQGKRSSYNAGLLPRLTEAGANDDKAFALWLDATKEQDYEMQGRSATEFSDFRNGKGKEQRNNVSFTEQLRLQCRFLALVVMQADAESDSSRLELALSAAGYLEDLVTTAKKLNGQQDELRRNSLDSVIARHLKLDISARREKGPAAYIPGSISEIYQQIVLPYYREKKAAGAIAAAWTKRIAQETALVELSKVPEHLEKFQKERLPELRWDQAKDLFAVGQQEPAAGAMVSIIKANLAHRNTAGWIKELAELVSPTDAPVMKPSK